MRLAIIDNHGLFMAGFAASLEQFAEIKKVYTFYPSEVEALTSLDKLNLDLLIIDINLDGISGFDLARRILLIHPRLPIAFITGHGNQIQLRNEAKEFGAAGFFLKDPKPIDLLEQIKKVVKGERVGLENQDVLPNLTPREKEVFHYLCEGFTNQQLSKQLRISLRQVERLKKNLMIKFDVKNDKALIRKGLNLGFEIIH